MEQSPAPTSYLGVEGVSHFREDGILFMDSRVRLADVTDGSSNTLLVGERPPSQDLQHGRWYGGWGVWWNADTTLGVRENGVAGLVKGCPDGPYQYGPGRSQEPCDVFHFWSHHPGGANFAFADGSVRFLPYSAASLLPDLASRAGGEVAAWPD